MVYKSFCEMPLWNRAVDFAAEVYRFSYEGHLSRDLRLRDQLRAAAVSISSNIAEGFEFRNNKQFVRFLYYAKGSASEVYSQLSVMHRAGLISDTRFQQFITEVSALSNMIGGFIQYLKARPC